MPRKKAASKAKTQQQPDTQACQKRPLSGWLRIRDPHTGRHVSVRRTLSPVDVMLRSGSITDAMAAAADQFHAAFRVAALDPLRAQPLLRLPPSTGDSLTERVEAARHRVARALAALGGQDSPAGSCVWHVIGCETSIREWAARCGWGGRPMTHARAQGVLVAALGVLAKHYGLDGPPSARRVEKS
jgi:hypothetical protein